MRYILDSLQPVIASGHWVHINQDAIQTFAQSVNELDFQGTEWSEETLLRDGNEETWTAFAALMSTLAFCYWGEPKWTIDVNGQSFDGNAAMLRALKRSIEDGFPLTDARYLSALSSDDLDHILHGNVRIPLFDERLSLLRTLGKTVSQGFDGSFRRLIDAADHDAAKIVTLLVQTMPTVFDDHVDYHGHDILFYKRAQVLPAYLHDLAALDLVPSVTGYETLTALADYKGPQLLRKVGILHYADDLARRVDGKIEIASGSGEEIEIRANTVWAIELLTQAIRQKLPDICPIKVFGCLWFKGQTKSPDDKPYHRTRTIWY